MTSVLKESKWSVSTAPRGKGRGTSGGEHLELVGNQTKCLATKDLKGVNELMATSKQRPCDPYSPSLADENTSFCLQRYIKPKGLHAFTVRTAMHYSRPARAWLVCNKEPYADNPGSGGQRGQAAAGPGADSSFDGASFLTHARDGIKSCTIHG